MLMFLFAITVCCVVYSVVCVVASAGVCFAICYAVLFRLLSCFFYAIVDVDGCVVDNVIIVVHVDVSVIVVVSPMYCLSYRC